MAKRRVKRRLPRIAVLLGTRPEIIKLAPFIRMLERLKRDYLLIHTGQHYSFEMDKLFFSELGLPKPKYHFSRGGSVSQAQETGRILQAVEPVLIKEQPDVILVQGDTNSVLAGALAASKVSGIAIGHVEAGLRSYDRSMPEELNRIVADRLSDFLFPPTNDAKKILLDEGIDSSKIFVTGNTIVDAVNENYGLAVKRPKSRHSPCPDTPFFLMTLHRQENVDDKKVLSMILKGVETVAHEFRTQVVFPMHPRTRAKLILFKIHLPECIRAVPPMGFLDFLLMEGKAKLLLTDSGGVQEEGCVLKVPCVTLRTSTERPETVRVGANIVAGHLPRKIMSAVEIMLRRKKNWPNPFGDGHASRRILEILEREI